jgi:hypothetical protein
MIENIIRQFDFNLAYANKLAEDLSSEQMTTVPFHGFENHPAFTLGHLVSGKAMLAEDLGGKFTLPDGWSELFLRKGPGDPRLPSLDKIAYPDKAILLKELNFQHEYVKKILSTRTEKDLSEPFTWRFSSYMPTYFDLTVFMCVNHEAMHLGQLAAWRRAMNLPSALGQL